MLTTVETAFRLIDDATPTVTRIRAGMRDLEVQAIATGDALDRVAAKSTGRTFEASAASVGKASDAHAGLADAAAAGGAASMQAADDQEKAAGRVKAAWKDSADAATSAAAVHQKAAASVSKSWADSGSAVVKTGKVVLAAVLATGAASIDAAMHYQAATRLFETQAGVSVKAAQQLSAGILKMAGSVGQSPDQLASGMYHVVSAMNSLLPPTNRTTVELGILRDAANLAAVGHSNLADTTYVLSSVMNSLGLKGLPGASTAMRELNAIVGTGDLHLQDLMGAMSTGLVPAAHTFGVTLHSVGAALSYMTAQGVPARQAATRLRMTLSLMGAPVKQSAEILRDLGLSHTQVETSTRAMTLALEKSGVSVTDLATDIRKPDGLYVALEDLKSHMDAAGVSATTQAAIISRAFGGGRSGGAIMSMYNNLPGLQEIYNKQTKVSAEFTEDLALRHKDLAFQLDQAKDGVVALVTEEGTNLIPVLEKGIDVAKDAAHWFTEHKLAAEGLALVIGGVLTVSVTAFALNVAKRLRAATRDFLQFGKAVARTPYRLYGKATGAGSRLGSAGPTDETSRLSGGLVGWDGAPAMVGSKANPLAVLTVDPSGNPLTQAGGAPAAGEEAAAAEGDAAGASRASAAGMTMTESGLLVPARAAESAVVPAAAEDAAAAGVTADATLGSKVAGLGSVVKGLGSRLVGGVGMAGMGLLATQLLKPILSAVAGKSVAHTVGQIGTAASIGAIAGPAGAVAAGGAAALNKLLSLGGSEGSAHYRSAATGQQVYNPRVAAFLGPNRGKHVAPAGDGGVATRVAAAVADQVLAGNSLSQFDKDLQKTSQLVDKTAGPVARALMNIATKGTGPMAKQARVDLASLQQAVNDQLTTAGKTAATKVAQIRASVTGGLSDATNVGSQALSTFASNISRAIGAGSITTGQGMQDIAKETNEVLSALGQKPLPMPTIMQVAKLQLQLPQAGTSATTSLTGAFAAGGRIPGPAKGDHVPLYARGGGLMGIADGGELVVNQHTERKADTLLSAFGTRLSTLVANETRPHYQFATGGRVPFLATGGTLSYGQLEGLWDQAGGPNAMAPLMAAIAEAESSGELNAYNPSGASGPWQILGQIVPGNIFNGLVNARNAVAKWRSQGLSAWTTYTSGAYRQFLKGGVPPMAGLAGGILGNVTAPKIGGTGVLALLAQAAMNKTAGAANSFLSGLMASTAGGSMGPVPNFPVATGPVPGSVQRMKEAGLALVAKNLPYITGGYGFDAPGLDCSGFVSTLTTLGGLTPGHELSGYYEHWGLPGPGKWVTTAALGPPSGPQGHVMMEVDGTFFESGGPSGRGPHLDSSWSQPFQYYRHPPGLDMGGRTGEPGHQLTDEAFRRLQRSGASWGGWHGRGVDMTVRRPTLFGAGEKGIERVQITPQSSATAGGVQVTIAPGGIVVRGSADDATLRRVFEKHLTAFVTTLEEELAEGAEQDEAGLIR